MILDDRKDHDGCDGHQAQREDERGVENSAGLDVAAGGKLGKTDKRMVEVERKWASQLLDSHDKTNQISEPGFLIPVCSLLVFFLSFLLQLLAFPKYQLPMAIREWQVDEVE